MSNQEINIGAVGDGHVPHWCGDCQRKDAEIARLKRQWRTLKAESGYRTTIDSMGNDDQQLKQLMDNIENRGGWTA